MSPWVDAHLIDRTREETQRCRIRKSRVTKQTRSFLAGEIEKQLKTVFEKMPHSVPLYLFTQKGENEVLNQAARTLIGAFQELSDKIEFKEFDLSHELAQKWDVTGSPTILFDPERYLDSLSRGALRGRGADVSRDILLLGYRASGLSEQSLKILEQD